MLGKNGLNNLDYTISSLNHFMSAHRKKNHWIVVAIATTILFVVFLSSYLLRNIANTSHFEVAQPAHQINSSLPKSIYISPIVNSEIVVALTQEENLPIAQDKPTYLLNSPKPGDNKNIIIYGHNSNDVFGNLHTIKKGDEIIISTSEGTIHPYRVTEILVVEPSNTKPLQPTNYELLTLYTCTGLLDSKRLVIQALPIEK